MVSEQLLEGPRGRRACLEWALACEQRLIDQGLEEMRGDSLNSAVFSLPDPAYRGAVVIAVPIGCEGENGCEDEAADPGMFAEETTARDVARALGHVAVVEPDAGQALTVLADVCAHAAYWQPPYAEDVAASDPEVRAGLARMAAALVAGPATRWWSDGVDSRNQWLTRAVPRPEWGSTDVPDAREPRDPAEVLATWRRAVADEEEQFRTWAAQDPGHMVGGPWWSTPPHGLAASTRALPGGLPLGVLCVEDGGWGQVVGRSLEVPESARVLEIDGPEDWAHLCREHPLDVSWSRRSDWLAATGRDGRWVIPDWSAVARHVDGVHLSVRGYLRTAGRAIAVDEERASVLAGWDPDRTFWFCPTRTGDDLLTWEECEEEPGWRRA